MTTSPRRNAGLPVIPRLGQHLLPQLFVFPLRLAGQNRLADGLGTKPVPILALQIFLERLVDDPILALIQAPGRAFQARLKVIGNAKTGRGGSHKGTEAAMLYLAGAFSGA